MSRLPPAPLTLDFVPAKLTQDAAKLEHLALANGRDLLAERLNRWARLAGLLVALAFVLVAVLR